MLYNNNLFSLSQEKIKSPKGKGKEIAIEKRKEKKPHHHLAAVPLSKQLHLKKKRLDFLLYRTTPAAGGEKERKRVAFVV